MTCTRCDYSTYEEKAALNHDYESVLTAPTCTEKGYTTYTCSHGDDTYVSNYVDALGHKYETVVTPPTCEEDGYTTCTCSVCGDTYVKNPVTALGHTKGRAVIENNVAPTCTVDGSYESVVYCTVCGGEVSRNPTAVPAIGHSYTLKEFIWAEDLSEAHTVLSCECGHTEEFPAELTWDESSLNKLVVTAAVSLEDETFAESKEIAAEVSGDTITLSLPYVIPDIQIVVASYSESGQMLNCAVETVQVDEDGMITLPVVGENVRVFFLTKDVHPLFPALAVQ